MARASTTSADFPSGPEDGLGEVEAGGRTWSFQHVSIGNPQCAIEVDGEELEGLDLATLGPPIERNELFPNRTNVSFWRRDADDEISARIFERGVGETMSSGTGASGAAVAAVLRGADSPVTVHLDGGDLEVDVGEDLSVSLTGWAVPVLPTVADRSSTSASCGVPRRPASWRTARAWVPVTTSRSTCSAVTPDALRASFQAHSPRGR